MELAKTWAASRSFGSGLVYAASQVRMAFIAMVGALLIAAFLSKPDNENITRLSLRYVSRHRIGTKKQIPNLAIRQLYHA